MKSLKGSFTLEAAVVVPFTMVVMVALIFLAFLAYDKASMTAICDYALMETAGNAGYNMVQVQNAVSELLDLRLISVSDIAVTSGGNDDSAYVSSSAFFEIPLFLMKELLGDKAASLSCNMTVSNLNGRSALILYKVILDEVSVLTENITE